uniref:Uncharacterized protein n=1 Tax=Salix viminalis TaxID=40686 RepID=A0A6N2N6R7_SALVM
MNFDSSNTVNSHLPFCGATSLFLNNHSGEEKENFEEDGGTDASFIVKMENYSFLCKACYNYQNRSRNYQNHSRKMIVASYLNSERITNWYKLSPAAQIAAGTNDISWIGINHN